MAFFIVLFFGIGPVILFMIVFVNELECLGFQHSECDKKQVLYGIPFATIWLILGTYAGKKLDENWFETIICSALAPWMFIVAASIDIWGMQIVNNWGSTIFIVVLGLIVILLVLFTKIGRFLVIVGLLIWIGIEASK